MSVFDLFKKKASDTDLSYSYAELKAHEVLTGTFDQAAELSAGKKVTIDTASYPEAVANLDALVKEKKAAAGTADHPGELVDLDGCRISIFLSKTPDRVPVILLYIDSQFVGTKIAGSERSMALYDAFREHRFTALHVEIKDDDDADSGCDYKVKLIMHEAE